MSRYILLLMSMLLCFAAPASAQSSSPLGPNEPVYLVVHSAVDCPVCKLWRESSTGLAAVEKLSKTRPYLRLVIIERKSIFGSEVESLYPQELRYLFEDRRDRYQLSTSTPLFEIVVRDKVILRMPGLKNWTDNVLPALDKIDQMRDDTKAPQG